MSQVSVEDLVMQMALDGLKNQSVDTSYAASLLPPVEREAWQRDYDALDAYYRGFRFEEYFDSNATRAMKDCWGHTSAWIKVQSQMCVKPPAEKGVFVQVIAAAGNLSRYNALTPDEQSWFIEWSRADRYRDLDPRLIKWLTRMGPVYVRMHEADRLEPFADKVRSMTEEWLHYVLNRS